MKIAFSDMVPAHYSPPSLMPEGARVIRRAARLSFITTKELTGASRQVECARARFAVFRVLRLSGWSLPRIGKTVGNRDHTTVLHGLRRAEELCKTDAGFAALCDEVAG